MNVSIPIDLELEGQYVLLRPSTPQDYPALQKIMSDKTTMKELSFMAHTENGGWTLDQIREREETFRTLLNQQTAVQLMIEDCASGLLVGNCGLNRIRFTQKVAEFGLIVDHKFWNKKHALETAFLCLDYAFSSLNLEQVLCDTSPINKRAIKLMGNLGLSMIGRSQAEYGHRKQKIESITYSLNKDQWPQISKRLRKAIA